MAEAAGRESDREVYFVIQSQPDVMTYLHGSIDPEVSWMGLLETIERFERKRVGILALEDRVTGKVVGFGGLEIVTCSLLAAICKSWLLSTQTDGSKAWQPNPFESCCGGLTRTFGRRGCSAWCELITQKLVSSQELGRDRNGEAAR